MNDFTKKILTLFRNFLLSIAVCVLFAFLNMMDSVALEQQLRCGIEAHTHTDLCYDGDFLICNQNAHTHDGNCYIVLLQENNINQILTLMEEDEAHSLEHVIDGVMSNALVLNQNALSLTVEDGQTYVNEQPEKEDDDESLTQTKVAELNETISNSAQIPMLVLNENLNNENDTQEEQDEETESENLLAAADTPTLMSVGDDPVTSNNNANFYVYLDGEWTCIGTLPYSRTRNGNRYNYTIQTSSVLSLVNSSLGTSYTYNSFDIAVATSENGSYTTSNVGIASTTTTIAYRQQSSATQTARYVRLIPNNGNATSTGFAFYTVEYEYPDGTVATAQYIPSGTTITLPTGNYEWSDGTTTYAAGETVTINKKTTFTATIPGPITFVNVKYNLSLGTAHEVSGATLRFALESGVWKVDHDSLCAILPA